MQMVPARSVLGPCPTTSAAVELTEAAEIFALDDGETVDGDWQDGRDCVFDIDWAKCEQHKNVSVEELLRPLMISLPNTPLLDEEPAKPIMLEGMRMEAEDLQSQMMEILRKNGSTHN